MKSGMHEAETKKFKKIETERKVWYVSAQDNSADNVYVSIKGEKPDGCFRGFGGATLKFALEDGTVDEVTGPWHSNTEALFNDTGLDIRDRHMTFGAVGKDRVYDDDHKRCFLSDVMFEDDDWVIGSFHRIKDIAQKLADESGERVWYYSQSQGGSTTSWLDPKTEETT